MPLYLAADLSLDATGGVDGSKPYSRLARLGIILGGSTALWGLLIAGGWGLWQLLS
jgi:hypothetical protein